MDIKNIVLIFLLFIYFVIAIKHFIKKEKREIAISQIQKKDINLFPWEVMIQERIQIDKKHEKKLFYVLRVLLIVASLMAALKIGTMMISLIGAIIIVAIMENKNNQLIDEAGIKHIESLNAFLDSYVPALASGLSNDQAMLKYINSVNNENLFNWWVNKEDRSLIEIENRWKRIVEIYEMIKFNEERGINNSLVIIEEIQKDIGVKQEYYNEYQSKMGEIKPIMLSYYVCVPFLLFISFPTTKDFWFGFMGLIASFVVVLLFFGSQFSTYKIREKTIKAMF